MVNPSGTVQQQTDYYPFGAAFAVANTTKNKYLYGGKELQDEVIGGALLGLYDSHARFYDPRTGTFTGNDPLMEKYPNLGGRVYCNNNPLLFVDPDGRDWYYDRSGVRQFSPEITSQDQLQEGETYIGVTDQVTDARGNVTESYRTDGSILYSREASAYSRMIMRSEQTGQETFGVIGDNGVLVLPDYKNKGGEVDLNDYGYSIKNGDIVDAEGTVFSTLATAHTHLGGSPPTLWTGRDYGDLGFAAKSTPYKPVYVLQMNGVNGISMVVAAPGAQRSGSYLSNSITKDYPSANLTNLLRGQLSLRQFTKGNNYRKILGSK